jgi:hypothetical protein
LHEWAEISDISHLHFPSFLCVLHVAALRSVDARRSTGEPVLHCEATDNSSVVK